eukprot:CAMPEP_0204618154 /NCGR_PEP_ID=MMETSP0717-20131115/4894_1 /ASSEMBLY_ACC=CAM_ASM_000666 /TAXON_ID=230516 /ORGANISM="Chaetoceros curvisetus" /LENGTH=243 /DNA_ID=CAMNT_0051631835 /DNA_START=295 /DNA_END=1026 /DNA_ORIENTATION=-
MEEAKRQREKEEMGNDEVVNESQKSEKFIDDDEMKKINDMKRFDELLNSESVTINYDIDGGNYKTQQQEEEEMNAGARGVDRIFEGDPAPTEPFEDLINMVTGNALGTNGKQRVVPWLNKSSAKQKDYLVIISDPRAKSTELRSTMSRMSKGLPADVLSRLVVINADTPAENRRFLKKNNIENIHVLCDEKREWMREYTVLGEQRWAMCMIVVQEERVKNLVRELDVELATQVIKTAVAQKSR